MKIPYLSGLFILGLITALILFAVHLVSPSWSEYGYIQSGGQQSYPVMSNRFRLEKTPEASHLFFEWEDHRSQTYSLDFSLSDTLVQASDGEFGFFPEEMDQYVAEQAIEVKTEMIRFLRGYALKRILKSKYGHYFYIEDTGFERFNLKISIPGNEDEKLIDEVRIEFRKISQALEKERQRYLPRLIKEENKHRKDFLRARGMRWENNQIMVDYGQVVQNNRPRVRPLVESLRPLVKEKSFREFISLLLAYVQAMDYGTPPEKEGDKMILGFWPPPKVLVNNLGDCDSKAATFAAVWLHFKRFPLLFITIPNHLFVGIAVPSFQGENITINGLSYTFCEVTGPALIPMGLITRYSRLHLESGDFRYEKIR